MMEGPIRYVSTGAEFTVEGADSLFTKLEDANPYESLAVDQDLVLHRFSPDAVVRVVGSMEERVASIPSSISPGDRVRFRADDGEEDFIEVACLGAGVLRYLPVTTILGITKCPGSRQGTPHYSVHVLAWDDAELIEAVERGDLEIIPRPGSE